MRNEKRTPILLALAGMLASLVTFVSPGMAVAAEYIPDLQWPRVTAEPFYSRTVTSPQGHVTVGCGSTSSNQEVVTYSVTGTEVRRLPRTQIDGVENCIAGPVVDKNGVLYGAPYQGPNLLAYSGNTLKWKYPTGCTYYTARPAVGADGNIYAINNNGRLIGLTPEVESGTTQPKLVLNVPASNPRCNMGLRALKNGLVTTRDMKATFYSYNGVNLGSPPSDVYVTRDEQINAEGRLFYDSYVESGGLRSANVSAYNGFRKEVMWTATVSANGAYVYGAESYSTPDGGVLVVLREKKSVGGVLTNEQVYSLVKLNAMGIKVWSKALPNQDVSDNTYGGPRIAIDQNGKIIVVRDGQLKTNDPYNGTVDGISIAMFDGNGNVLYEKVMRGNLDKPSGTVYGYRTRYLGDNSLVIAPNTLFISAVCTEGCSDTSTKLYPFKVTGVGLDYTRNAVFSTASRPTASYIALGDSFSSGEGVAPFEVGTDTPNLNTCHRSNYAYARLISGTSSKIPSLGSGGFRACSGAVTTNITDAPQWNEGTQLDLPVWTDSTTQLVTLTIGGNDIGFADLAKSCVDPLSSCAINSTAYNKALNKINNELPGKLAATYKNILKYAPNAKVYVLGYPHVIANKTASDGPDARCAYMQDGGTNWADAQGVRSIVTKLNEKVAAAITTENTPRLRFVDVNGSSSPFQGHEICGTGASYFLNLDQAGTNAAYVFHPNKLGQEEGYATIAKSAINAG